jgi:hypothetical protein
MRTPKLSPLIIALRLILAACEFNMTYTNRQIDKEAAEKVTNLLLLNLESKDYAAADTLFSKGFFKSWSKKKLNNIFQMSVDKLGEIQDTNLDDWGTKVVSGTNFSGEYAFLYNVRYQYYSGQVAIHLIKDPDGKIRVDGYHIKSEGFDDK